MRRKDRSDRVDADVVFDTFDGEPLGELPDGEDAVWGPDGGGGLWVDERPRFTVPISARQAVAGSVVVAFATFVAAVVVAVVAVRHGAAVTGGGADRYTLMVAPEPVRLAAEPDERWTFSSDDASGGSFAVSRDVVVTTVVAPRAGALRPQADVVAVDLITGSERWRHRVDASAGSTSVNTTDFEIVLATFSSFQSWRRVVALDEVTGEVRWERNLAGSERIFPVFGVPALVVLGPILSFVDPRTGDEIGSVAGEALGLGRDGSLSFVADGVVSTARVVDGAVEVVDLAASGDPAGLRALAVVGDEVVGFDAGGLARFLPPPGSGDGTREQVPIVGLPEPDEFDVRGAIEVDGRRLIVVGSNEVYGLELVDGELRFRWQRSGFPLSLVPTRETVIIRLGDQGNRSDPDSPTMLVDARDGRRLGGDLAIGIVDPVQLVDDGLVVTEDSAGPDGAIVAYGLDGAERWRREVGGAVRAVDGAVVVLRPEPSGGFTLTALGAV